ncbi:unnamed protein product, partial [Vitis vinifera]|uniref:Uncharacterized protein n=1 Tax=Vitis vinifera TaxID=29760 RepID=D7SYB7_VITVI
MVPYVRSCRTEGVLKFFLTKLPPGPLYLPKENPFGYEPGTPIPLPSWLSEEELNYYVSKFDKTGFLGGLNYYRIFDRSWEFNSTMVRESDHSTQ